MRTYIIFTFVSWSWNLIPQNGLMEGAGLFLKLGTLLMLIIGTTMAIFQDIKELTR